MKLVRAVAPAVEPVALSDPAEPMRRPSMVVPDDYAAATPLIGRQAQLRELEEHYRLATAGAGRVVLVAGEAGVGKTRLLREFLGRLPPGARRGVLRGHCYDEDPPVPYGPVVDALRSFARRHGAEAIARAAGPWAGPLTRLLPELGDPASTAGRAADPYAEKWRLFEAIYHAVLPDERQGCRVVILEDLHWSDGGSQELVRYLARLIESQPVLLLATYRTDEPGRRHPLAGLIAQLARERRQHEVRLGPLSREECADLLASALGRRLPAPLVGLLWERTGGNPFFAEELLRSLGEGGGLEQALAAIQAGGRLGHIPTPLSIADSILARTADLDELTTAVLHYAATIGRHFDFELLLRLTGIEEAALLRAVATLVARQLVVEEVAGAAAEDRYRFRHDLTREAIYGSLLRRERRLKHRAILQALEERHRADLPAVADQLAHHSLQAGETVAAARYARLAGERAARVYAYREAVAHYRVALDLLGTDEPAARAELCERLAQAAHPLGDVVMYAHYWREAQRLYEGLGDRRKVADFHLWLGIAAWQQGDLRAVEEHLDAVRPALESSEGRSPDGDLALAYSICSQLSMLAARPRDAIAWGERALCLAERLDDGRVRMHAFNNIGCALLDLGDAGRGLEYLERSVALARDATYRAYYHYRAYHNFAENLAALGEFQRAAALLREGLARLEEGGVELHAGFGQGQLGWLELEFGRWDEARALLDRAIEAGERGMPMARLLALPWQGELLLRQGQTDEARRLLEEALPACEAGGLDVLRVLLPTLARVRLAGGDVDGAARAIDRCVAAWRDAGAPAKSDRMLADGVEVYLRAGRTDAAGALLAALAAAAERGGHPLALACLADARGLLAAHQGRHQDAAGHFARAAERWQELGAQFREARARRRWAESLLQAGALCGQGGQEEARRQLALAREIGERLGAAPELQAIDATLRRHRLAPRATAAPSGGDRLTPREREVLALIAQGHGNREIAERLFITEKTAEHHVSNILGKLGFTSRVQAAAYAVEQGLATAPEALAVP